MKAAPNFGYYITDQAPGAWPNGVRVCKTGSLPGDAHQDGSQAVILGSVGEAGLLGYFVEWADMPGVACFVAGPRLRRLGP